MLSLGCILISDLVVHAFIFRYVWFYFIGHTFLNQRSFCIRKNHYINIKNNSKINFYNNNWCTAGYGESIWPTEKQGIPEFWLHFCLTEDFFVIIMCSKWRFVYASVYRWTANALRLTKSSLGVMCLVSLSCQEPVLYSHWPNQFCFSIL